MFRTILGVYGEPIEYQHRSGGEPYTIQGLFKTTFTEVERAGMESHISSAKPTIEVTLGDLKEKPVIGDIVRVREDRYRVFLVQQNSQASEVTMVLKKYEQT